MSESDHVCVHPNRQGHVLSLDDACVRAAEEVPVTSFGDATEQVVLGQDSVFRAGHQPLGWRVISGPALLRDLIR
jgi:hypothetical protein